MRFAQALGFEGFPELQAAARDEYRRARDGEQGTVDLANPPLFPIDQTEFEAALAADHVNVEETAKKIDRDEVEASIELISRAERIVLCGTDQMAFFASYLRHLLMLLDLRCEVVASPSQEGLARLGRIDENAVLVGFSAGRPHPLVVRAMKLARNRRAATIAVADATLSEVAKLGDHKLFYSLQQPRLRALPLRAAGRRAGARVRRVRAGRARLRRSHQGVPAEVAGASPAASCSEAATGLGSAPAPSPRTPPRCPPAGPDRHGRGGSGGGTARSPSCDPIDPSRCLLPWPNDHFTKKARTPTGRRLALSAALMPRNVRGVPIEPADYNRSDGFSPGAPLITKVPGLDTPAALARTGVVPITDLARTYDRHQPVVVINARTRRRQLIWAELDSNATSPANAALLIQPPRTCGRASATSSPCADSAAPTVRC